jgi:signal peptidase I/conjugal transfer pilin signal peptidase TrbI
VFCSNEDAVETGECKGIKVTKKVGCVAGDLLEVRKGHAYFCNHVLIGHAKDTTKDGQPLDVFMYNGRVPDGKLFAFGTHKDSYDSRYFGFVDVSRVKRLKGLFDAKPFLTWLLAE